MEYLKRAKLSEHYKHVIHALEPDGVVQFVAGYIASWQEFRQESGYLQALQLAVLDLTYDSNNDEETRTLNVAYNHIRDVLIDHFGGPQSASVNEVDPDLGQIYSDVYKDDNGIRPRWFTAWSTANDYLTKRQERA